MGGCTERYKVRNKCIGGITTSSNNNAVKEIKLPLLQKYVVFALPSINFKIDIGATHYFHKIISPDLPQQQTSNYNPEVKSNCTQRSIHGIFCNHKSSNSFSATICYKVSRFQSSVIWVSIFCQTSLRP